ncbi:deoxyguanosinetriphosphate triphosphohydrolase [Corynebacterium sp. CCM 8835]|uniref:Deoxyguanosinetriphosphate triphosphohydrolase-like protein n=1 Tax=Corynebacterium antarcticum TaxID=2800405 RepID=A0ABS1FNS5_9CORY|nr:deoxyguanosinetriphosphate triphosphohydrolase [Corynebacterium antarcticum]MCL0245125.1 deoxyguanosinetriphosphate triphosphohydrolase [Corynebacterium antarcticum]MCX7539323.1 deoxyguanosinetriphosphate triphosphohydrolase [Corynebacterium antarcticum]
MESPARYRYTAEDRARFCDETPKGSRMDATSVDNRSAFSRDRARVLHSAALRRLADKTQVVGPRDGDTPRTRLTHSLEVAQIARGIASGIGVNPDLADLAGLCHDIGHPPYGHNGEVALDELAADCGGFEGNAQTLRIISRLEPKILAPDGSPHGLNLTRASLDAACKYPWTRIAPDGTPRRKYGAYDEEAELLAWIREGHDPQDTRPSIEGQVMDWSDDVAYSVHDVEDGICSGRISLRVLWDLFELAELAEKGAEAFGGDPEEMIAAADSLRQLPVVAAAADYDGSLSSLVALKALTSELVGRYVGATVGATLEAAGDEWLGRMHGRLVVPPAAAAEVQMLKTIAVLYVMEETRHQQRQNRQRERIARVHDYLTFGAPGTLDPIFAAWWADADSDAARARVIIDQIASMTESRLERTAKQASGVAGYYI